MCWCARSACTPPLLAGVCGAGVCALTRVLAAPRRSWLGCWGVCVFVCVLRLYPATPGWGVQCGCVCLGSAFGCAQPLLAGVLGCVCVCVRAPPVPRLSWLGRAVRVCVLGLGFRPRPATPGGGAGVFVCVCVRAAPVPATPGRSMWCGCVCLGSGFSGAPPLLVGVLGCVCVCVRAPPVPRHCWLGREVRVCVLGVVFRLRPATPGWGVRVYVCLCACCACTPPLLAGVCDVGVCAWAGVVATPLHSRLGRWGVFASVCALCLYLATPGRGVRCGCVCLCSGSGCAPPVLAELLGCVCVYVPAPLVPRHSSRGGVCVCGFEFRLLSAFFRFGCWVAWPLACAASVCRHLLVGLSVVWGCAGVAVGGVCPPTSPFCFRTAGGGGWFSA